MLAIDTSGAYASVAVFDGRAVLAEETWLARRRHDDELFSAIERVAVLAGIALTAVRRLAVALGPGSFTGLRVGIAAAQGMARASGAGVVGVPTLDVVAHPFRTGRVRVCAMVPAGRGEHYSAIYRRKGSEWSRRSRIDIGSAADLARSIAVDTVFAGEIDAATAAELRERLGARALFPSASAATRRAGHLAELGWARAEAGEAVAPEGLVPIYVRPPAIRGRSGELLEDAERAATATARGD